MIIAIVGTGVTGTSMLINLYEEFSKRKDLPNLHNLTIITVEERPVNGSGYAYDVDSLLPAHLLNLPADKMAILADSPIAKKDNKNVSKFEFASWKSSDFTNWIRTNIERLVRSQPELIKAVGLETKAARQNFQWGKTFYPRALFGLYLQQRFSEAVRRIESLGVCVISYNRTTLLNVKDFGDRAEMSILQLDTKMKETLLVDRLLLATGRWLRKDAYLSNCASMLLPFPAQTVAQAAGVLQTTPPKKVIVLGMGLTGIDAIFSVLKGEFRRNRRGRLCYFAAPNENRIIAVSRIGQFSMVKDDNVIQPQLHHFTSENLHNIRQKSGGYFRLSDLRVLLENELAPHIDESMTVLGFLAPSGLSAEQKLKRDMKLARAGNKTYGVIQQLLAYRVASQLSPKDKELFVKKLKRHFLRNVAAMPYINAEKLMALFDAGVLESVCVGDKAKIKLLRNGKFSVFYSDQETGKPKRLVCDIMIRATGDTLNARNADNRLIHNLLRTKTVMPAVEVSADNVKRQVGGIQIQPESYAVIGQATAAKRHGKSKTIYAIGMLAMNWGLERDFASASISATCQLASQWVSELTQDGLKDRFLTPFDVFQEWSESAARNNSPQIKNFTIFSKHNVFRPDPDELLEMADATTSRPVTIFTNRVSRLVCYKPEREALHWTARFLGLLAKVTGQNEYEQLVEATYFNHVLNGIDFVAIYKMRAALEREVSDILRAVVANDAKAYVPRNYNERAVHRIYLKTRARYLNGEYVPGLRHKGEDLESVVQKLALDHLYDTSAFKKHLLQDTVFRIICDLGRQGHFQFHKFRTRDITAFIVTGGVGSGKSSLTARVPATLRLEAMKMQSFAIINRDKYRRLVLDDQEVLYKQFGIITLFAHDEVTHILSKTYQAYQQVRRSFGGVPDCIVEKNSPADFQIADQLSREANCSRIRLVFLHLPIDAVMRRTFNRSMHPDFLYDRGKFLNSEIILAVHAGLSKDFVPTIMGYAGRDCKFTILGTETRLHKVIADGDVKRRRLRVYEEAQFKEFLQKQYMNISAKRYEDIYDPGVEYDQKIFKKLLDLSMDISIQLLDARGKPYAEMSKAAVKVHDKLEYNKRFVTVFPCTREITLN